jgi:hypothetical protein
MTGMGVVGCYRVGRCTGSTSRECADFWMNRARDAMGEFLGGDGGGCESLA